LREPGRVAQPANAGGRDRPREPIPAQPYERSRQSNSCGRHVFLRDGVGTFDMLESGKRCTAAIASGGKRRVDLAMLRRNLVTERSDSDARRPLYLGAPSPRHRLKADGITESRPRLLLRATSARCAPASARYITNEARLLAALVTPPRKKPVAGRSSKGCAPRRGKTLEDSDQQKD
jgi:hypothetical protein